MFRTGHVDLFARDHLPSKELQPDLIFNRPEVQYPERLNAAVELLDRRVEQGDGERIALRNDDATCTYRQLQHQVNRIAHVLRNDMSLVPGNRVLLRGANNPMMAACFCASTAGVVSLPATVMALSYAARASSNFLAPWRARPLATVPRIFTSGQGACSRLA